MDIFCNNKQKIQIVDAPILVNQNNASTQLF